MAGEKDLFALAEKDDAAALVAALGDRPAFGVRNDNGETLLLFSLYRGRVKCLEALAKSGGLTLHEAAATGDAERVAQCVKAAPWTIQSLSADGWPALHLAAFLGRDDALECLLSLGADAHQWARAVESNLAIHAAAAGGRLGRAALARLFAVTGDPDVLQKQGYTALMIAAANGASEICRALMEAGADRSKRLADGRTAAEIARERGHSALSNELT